MIRKVEHTKFNKDTFVLTVSISDEPTRFKTIVFSNNKSIDGKQWTASTHEEASIFHFNMCSIVKKVLSSNEE